MSFEVRPCRLEELRRALVAIFHYFGREPDEETLDASRASCRSSACTRRAMTGQVVGGAGVVPVPADRARAAGCRRPA